MPKKLGSGLFINYANSLIEASYKLSLNEQRVIMAYAAKLDDQKPLPKDNLFELTAEEFSELCSVDTKSSYKEMEKMADNLYERDILSIAGHVKKRMRWVYSAEYVSCEGKLRLEFSPIVTPYLTLLHQWFTKYHIEDVAKLQSVYHYRLYEMLMRFRDMGILVVTLDDFRERLQLGSKYTRFSNLKARIIDPAVNEISAKTPFEVSWGVFRKDRVVQQLEFRFKVKAQMSLL